MARRAHSLQRLLDQINQSAPNRSKLSDGWIGDAEHATRSSDHNPDDNDIVHAQDITHDPTHFDAHRFARVVLAKNADARIKYIISNGEVWDALRGWRKYTGKNPHNHHIHVSVNANNGDLNHAWNISPTKPFKVLVDGKSIKGWRNPDGVTIVQLRELSELLGLTVKFDQANNTVTVTST